MGADKIMEEHNVLPETLVISSSSFLNMLDTLVNHFGSAGESMIFQMGRENGMTFCRNAISEVEHEDESLVSLFNLVLEKASRIGWANMVVEEFELQSGAIKVVMKDNTFKHFCVKMHMPQCFFLRGYLSGIIKELTNVDYIFSNSECYAHGDEHCSIRLIAETS